MNTFDNPSEKKASAHQKAALRLIDLLKIGDNDAIINIICGHGHITDSLTKITKGKVIGIDISETMIKRARSLYSQIEFKQIALEDLDYNNEFDIAFCSCPFQWLSNPDKAIKAIYKALKISGKLGLACPATYEWAPWFNNIIYEVTRHKEISSIFSYWKDAWFHLSNKRDYKILFEKHGFTTTFIEVEYEESECSVEEAFNIYLLGLEDGFTGKKHYDIEIDDNYIFTFEKLVREEIVKQSKGGKIKVNFNRLYYIGQK